MKYLIILYSLISLASHAENKLKYNEAQKVMMGLAENVLNFEGVNSVGLGACDSDSGQISASGDEYCVVVTTETKKAADALGKIYLSGSQFDGVNFWIQVRGLIKAEIPRTNLN